MRQNQLTQRGFTESQGLLLAFLKTQGRECDEAQVIQQQVLPGPVTRFLLALLWPCCDLPPAPKALQWFHEPSAIPTVHFHAPRKIHLNAGEEKQSEEGKHTTHQGLTPGTEDSHLFVSYQEAVGVLVLTGDAVVREELGQLLDKVHDLLVPGDVGHGEAAGRAVAAVRHPLGRNKGTVSGGQRFKVRSVLPSFVDKNVDSGMASNLAVPWCAGSSVLSLPQQWCHEIRPKEVQPGLCASAADRRAQSAQRSLLVWTWRSQGSSQLLTFL